MKRAVRAGVRLAPLSLGRLAFLARGLVSLARRCVGIFGRLRRQIEFGTQCRVVGAQCFDFPGQTFDRLRLRKNEADKRFLIKRIKRIAIHSQLELTRDFAVKLSQPRQLLPNSNSARNEDVSNCLREVAEIDRARVREQVRHAKFVMQSPSCNFRKSFPNALRLLYLFNKRQRASRLNGDGFDVN